MYRTLEVNGKFSCDCGWYTHRKTDCKHIKALKAEMGITIETQPFNTPVLKKASSKDQPQNFHAI